MMRLALWHPDQACKIPNLGARVDLITERFRNLDKKTDPAFTSHFWIFLS
jgi:hypothetical protein